MFLLLEQMKQTGKLVYKQYKGVIGAAAGASLMYYRYKQHPEQADATGFVAELKNSPQATGNQRDIIHQVSHVYGTTNSGSLGTFGCEQ